MLVKTVLLFQKPKYLKNYHAKTKISLAFAATGTNGDPTPAANYCRNHCGAADPTTTGTPGLMIPASSIVMSSSVSPRTFGWSMLNDWRDGRRQRLADVCSVVVKPTQASLAHHHVWQSGAAQASSCTQRSLQECRASRPPYGSVAGGAPYPLQKWARRQHGIAPDMMRCVATWTTWTVPCDDHLPAAHLLLAYWKALTELFRSSYLFKNSKNW